MHYGKVHQASVHFKMDGFNPLDLLASAAELQQKHDDGPEKIIITRQRRNNGAKTSLVPIGQKENRELSHNNNNITKNKPSVVIVKKIKKVEISPELEKMLDEHNYGNAKRNNVKIEKGSDQIPDINGRRKNKINVELDNYHNSEQFIQTTTTEGQNVDKITTVVSNTSSQPSDSECIHVKCKVDCTDKDTCSNRICTCKQESAENKCSEFDAGTKYDCLGHTKVVLDRSGQKEYNQVIQPGDNVSRTPDTLIMKYDNKQQTNCDISSDNSELFLFSEDGLKLDEQTGEFISKNGAKILIKHPADEKQNIQDCSDGTDQEKNTSLSDDLNSSNVVYTEMGSSKTMKVETVSNKNITESTSDTKKTPFVKVVPSEVSEPRVEKQPQTLVINITRGLNSSDKLSTASSMQNFPDTSSDSKSSDEGIIRSLLVNNKQGEVNKGDKSAGNKKKPVVLSIMSPKSKFELSHISENEFGEKSVSCDTLKDFEMSDSVCTEDSSSSVHLLSPDCRNPDSVGIAESPVTQSITELSYSGDSILNSSSNTGSENRLLNRQEKCESEVSGELPFEGESTFSALTSSPLHSNISDRAPELETPGIESVSDARELSGDCGLLLTEKSNNCDNSANDILPASGSGNDIPVFRFDSDHCYAGLPGRINMTRASVENENSVQSEEGSEAQTPLGSTSELSQDSGYEDVTQSPEVEQPLMPISEKNVEKPSTVKNLVPVLVSVNSNGCLTVHDTNLTKTLGGQVFLPENMKIITGTNFTSISQAPLILSPVAMGKNTSPVLTEAPKLIQAKPESIIGLLSPIKTPEIKISNESQEISPPKIGKFRIGTFASFSNTGVGLDSPTKLNLPVKVASEEKPKKISPASSRPSSGKSGKSSPVVDTLGSLVQKVKSSLSPVSHVEMNGVDHIQHDHDYCTKNLMPSVINSFLEARLLSKDTPKGKVTHTKGKKSDLDYKSESKSGKRKRSATSVTKEDVHDDFEVDSESDTHSIPEPLRPKYRSEKYIEPKRTDPKVKITGSSNFQDQFVYFMNTKKRSRRRESKDIPLPYGTDRVFIPPKPGDIVVPHLTDQDIENLRIRSKQSKHPPGTSCCNSLRNEFMAAKLNNATFSAIQPAEPVVDDEKNIINTILSLENEDLASPVQNEPAPYNESMEMYGQGLGADIMNLLPEQMNLTPEQMDILYSAVDEVQNSSPGLVGAEKLVSTETSDPAFQFPMTSFEDSGMSSTSTVTAEVNQQTNVETSENNVGQEPVTKDATETTEEPVNDEDTPKPVIESGDNVDTPSVTEDKSPVEMSGDKQTVESAGTGEKIEEIQQLPEKSDAVLNVNDENVNTPTSESFPVSNSDTLEIPAPNVVLNSSNNNDESTKTVSPLVPNPELKEEKTLFPSPGLTNGSVASSFVSDISSVNSSSITSEISLPQIDKSLDLLGNDFRLDKGDLFPDASVSDSAVVQSSVVQQANQVDYNAPWIVTVSMYWNDLPAIMINNQPFVRLVDIHKQILPAKDTGILKKRCQLMGIEVENCSEMQRYFLVQYGRAFNSKSTLIISKDNAKVLIGYYVDPQPKATRPEEHHKSIIDHRREQLRRIALARRAAVRAQRMSEKKDEPDPREIKEPQNDLDADHAIPSSVHELAKHTQIPTVGCSPTSSLPVQADGDKLQRATRHKKINFLEMLRGDSTSHAGVEEGVDEHGKKNVQKLHQGSTDGKRKRSSKEKKAKVVQYTIETDSSEETESVESDFSSDSYDTESTSGSEIQVLKRPVKQRKINPNLVAKVKSRMKTVPKSYSKGSLKVKIGLKKSRPTATSTPVTVQVVNKPTSGTKLAMPVYRSKLISQKSRKESATSSYSTPIILGKSVLTISSDSEKEDLGSSTNSIESSSLNKENVQFNSTSDLDSMSGVSSDMTKKIELKISPTLPENILDTSELQEVDHSESKLMESVNIQTDSCSFENDDDADTGMCNAKEATVDVENKSTNVKENQSEGRSVPTDTVENSKSRSQSPVGAESSISVMKRKENVQISSDETPIRVVHRDLSPQSHERTRSQLGELFVDHYHNKKSLCMRCYTCRKMMSVDNFLRHLHDVSGGLMSVNIPRTIDLSDPDLLESDYKNWETFLRKKELFDNNQLPSPDIVGDGMMYSVDGDSNHSFPESGNSGDKSAQAGPRIITTPVSPFKKEKIVRKSKITGKTRLISNQPSTQVPINIKQTVLPDTADGVRTSSRKRKVKHLYGFEDYSFTKFPRLMKNAVVEEDDNQIL